MKKMYLISIAILAFLVMVYLILAKYLSKDYSDYFLWEKNNQFIYLVTKDSVSKKDTLKLIMLKNTQNNKNIKWILSSFDKYSNNYISDTIINETTTEIVNYERLSWNHPEIKYFTITEYIPDIDIALPIKQGYYKEFKENITSIDIENGADTTVSSFSGHIKISGKIFFQTPVFQDTCWIIEGKYNKLNSSFMSYFNNQFGFVYIKYKYYDSAIELELLTIE